MASRNRVIAVVLGLALPLAFAGSADARTHHRHRGTHVAAASSHAGAHRSRIHRVSHKAASPAPVADTAGS